MPQQSTIRLQKYLSQHLHLPNPGKTPLLFIPGNMQDIQSVQAFTDGLSQDYDYHVVELPGMGSTPPLHPSKPISFLSDCLKEFVDTHIKKPFILVSCSYATPIAIEFCKSDRRVQKLVLAGSMQEIPESDWPTILGLMADCLRSPQKFANDMIDMLTSKNAAIPKQNAIRKATIRKTRSYSDREFWCFIYNTIRLMSYKPDALDKILCPTLCFTGEFDPYVTPSNCQQLSEKIPNAEFQVITDTDHLFHIERPEETVLAITDWLSRTALTVRAA